MKRGKRVLQDERETWAYRVPKESKVRHFVMLQTVIVVRRALLMNDCLSINNWTVHSPLLFRDIVENKHFIALRVAIMVSNVPSLEPRANGRNVVGCYKLYPLEHHAACLLLVVGSCYAKFETGHTFKLHANGPNSCQHDWAVCT